MYHYNMSHDGYQYCVFLDNAAHQTYKLKKLLALFMEKLKIQ